MCLGYVWDVPGICLGQDNHLASRGLHPARNSYHLGAPWMARAAACLAFLWDPSRMGMALSAVIDKLRLSQANVARTPTPVV